MKVGSFARTVPLAGKALVAAVAAFVLQAAGSPSNTEIKQAIIRESVADYPGPCPCPYNIMRNGKRCGRFSAYSKPGGREPICYESDVTDDMIRDYRRRHGL